LLAAFCSALFRIFVKDAGLPNPEAVEPPRQAGGMIATDY
jgi:hypothetical protein